MDIPRRKNRQHSDKLTAELLFFCFWLTHCGEVELGAYAWYGQHSTASYRRYAKELEKIGAIPRMKLRGDDRDCRHNRRFISDPPVENFAPEIRFDWEDDHLRRLARLVCMAASVLAPDGELSAFPPLPSSEPSFPSVAVPPVHFSNSTPCHNARVVPNAAGRVYSGVNMKCRDVT